MPYFDEYKFEELIVNLIDEGFSTIIESTLEYINFITRDNIKQYDLSKYILLHGDDNENYSKEEYEILNLVDEFRILGKINDSNLKINIYEVIMDIQGIDHDYFTCALVKILDKAIKEPLIIFSINNDEVIIGLNTPIEFSFSDNFIISNSINYYGFKQFSVWLFETILYELDNLELYYSLVEYVLDNCGIFETRDYYSGPLDYDEIKYFMKIFNITHNYKSGILFDGTEEYDRVMNYQKKYKILTKELAFIKPRNETSYDYIEFIEENAPEQFDIFGVIDDTYAALSDEIDKIINNLSDEEFNYPLKLIDKKSVD